MSGLLFLQTEDFSIQKGIKGNILCHSIRGLSLLLFYSTNCQHSRTLVPIFKKLGLYLNLKQGRAPKHLPKWMLKALGLNRVK
jgi:hypothetical protein